MNNNNIFIPPIPPTPRPTSLINIEHDAKQRFGGILWIQKTSDRNLEDYFLEYGHWEVYSETTSYSKRIYSAAYKGLMKEYQNFLCILNDDTSNKYYVIAKRVPGELDILEPYCQCLRCIAFPINPLKYLWCPNCTKCIKAGKGYASKIYIDRAIEIKRLKDTNQLTYKAYWENIKWIRGTEITILVVMIAIMINYFN